MAMNIRFKQAFDYLKERRRLYNSADLSRILGVTKSYLSEVMNGKRIASEKFLLSFAETFPEISSGWLLNGEGQMLTECTRAVSRERKEVDWEAYRRNTAATILVGLHTRVGWPDEEDGENRYDGWYTRLAEMAVAQTDKLIEVLKRCSPAG